MTGTPAVQPIFARPMNSCRKASSKHRSPTPRVNFKRGTMQKFNSNSTYFRRTRSIRTNSIGDQFGRLGVVHPGAVGQVALLIWEGAADPEANGPGYVVVLPQTRHSLYHGVSKPIQRSFKHPAPQKEQRHPRPGEIGDSSSPTLAGMAGRPGRNR